MKNNRDRKRRSLLLAGFFFLAVSGTTLYLYAATGDQEDPAGITSVLYGGLGLILVSGMAAIWVSSTGKNDRSVSTEDKKNYSPLTGQYSSGFMKHPGHNGGADGTEEEETCAAAATLHSREKTIRYISALAEPILASEIAERKRVEQDIHRQNKKVTESIKYAKRIQSAILPNSRLINRVLPDSFILYKPRDVVSGDFPWFAQVRNETFMAAVDCTGHGVPGALLSLVGYFLLNDIVRSRRITDPGKILDLLDEGVSITLKPDEDAGTKDGMDISLCKIDTEKREVVYAGAHRPLYVVRAGVIEEIKGNKFPIGGGIFKNQTNFTSYTVKLNRGDSIFFCSDGFSDQFGGPEGRKFGTRKLREIIGNVHNMSMKEALKIFEEQWEEWKGDQKQTDDVLLIGIKFN